MSARQPQPTGVLISRLQRVARKIEWLLNNDWAGTSDTPSWRARANTCWQAAGRLEDYHAKLTSIHAGMVCSCRLQPLVDGPVPCPTCQLGALIGRTK